jgi:uncharacterized protein (TIGR02147 family)
MIYEHNDYRTYLKAVLVEKIEKNASYSLRALAKQLQISPATLSGVIRGKRNLSEETASTIASKLGLEGPQHEYFCILIQLGQTNDAQRKEIYLNRLKVLNPQLKIRDISVDLFKTISDWYHSAILCLSEIDDFNFTPQDISKRLNISIFEAEAAIERLERLELLHKEKSGKYTKNTDFLATSKIPNESLRKFHRQTIQKAMDSLETQSPAEKLIGSETMAIDSDLLPKASTLMEEFFSKMLLLANQSKRKKEVYHLGVQFFNFVKQEKKQ